jgi:formylglycine-generating enzyme
MARSIVPPLLALGALIGGCSAIAGFEDLSRDCPAEEPLCADAGAGASGGPGGATGNGGNAGAAGGAGGARMACDSSEQPRTTGGPAMAKFVRPDGSCFWIDTTEVTEAEYADYVASNPPPSGNPSCAGKPALSEGCEAQAEAGSPGDLPKTCVDWCAAQSFCLWAGKELCNDDPEALGDLLLEKSDYHFACSEGGDGDFISDPCATTVCNVPGAGFRGIQQAGKTANCFVTGSGTRVFDLIGNVSEWTEECLVENEFGPCLVRGGSFDDPACCDQHRRIPRRTAAKNIGFRCCYYAPR